MERGTRHMAAAAATAAFIVLLALAATTPAPASAEMHWVCPTPRGVGAANQQTGPCGGVAAGTPMTVSPGPMTVVWEETHLSEGSPFRIQLSMPGNDGQSCVILDHIPHDARVDPIRSDPTRFHRYYLTIQIPDVNCVGCSLQIISPIMQRDLSGAPLTCAEPAQGGVLLTCGAYYSCADITITGSAPASTTMCPAVSDWPHASTPFVYTIKEAEWGRGFPVNVPGRYLNSAAIPPACGITYDPTVDRTFPTEIAVGLQLFGVPETSFNYDLFNQVFGEVMNVLPSEIEIIRKIDNLEFEDHPGVLLQFRFRTYDYLASRKRDQFIALTLTDLNNPLAITMRNAGVTAGPNSVKRYNDPEVLAIGQRSLFEPDVVYLHRLIALVMIPLVTIVGLVILKKGDRIREEVLDANAHRTVQATGIIAGAVAFLCWCLMMVALFDNTWGQFGESIEMGLWNECIDGAFFCINDSDVVLDGLEGMVEYTLVRVASVFMLVSATIMVYYPVMVVANRRTYEEVAPALKATFVFWASSMFAFGFWSALWNDIISVKYSDDIFTSVHLGYGASYICAIMGWLMAVPAGAFLFVLQKGAKETYVQKSKSEKNNSLTGKKKKGKTRKVKRKSSKKKQSDAAPPPLLPKRNHANGRQSSGSGKLPPNWEAMKSSKGDTYFYNKVTHESRWERPKSVSGGVGPGSRYG